jgi:hypothetical protein
MSLTLEKEELEKLLYPDIYSEIQDIKRILEESERNISTSAKSIDTYLNKRPLSSYSHKVLNELSLIAINPNKGATPFGSYIYRFQRYPGDIDGREEIGICCSKEQAARKYVQAIKRIVKNIKSKRSHYYSEIKAGINPLFDFSVGNLIDGKYIPNPDLLTITASLYSMNLLTEQEMKMILFSINNEYESDSDKYDVIEYVYRKHRILRWSADEIEQGYKILEDKSQISLYDAIQMDTMTKIDEITIINNTFIEITNNWLLSWIDKKGNNEVFNKEYGVRDDLVIEIEKFYYSNTFYSPFKMIKRIYSYSRYKYFETKNNKWKKYIELMVPILQSDISATYQIKSELDTLIMVLSLYKKPSPITINNQLDNTKQRIASILQIDQSSLLEFNNLIDNAVNERHNKLKITIIEEVVKKLSKIINSFTIIYLKEIHMNPPPRDLLPQPRKYGNLVRQPDEIPINPIKETIKELKIKGSGCDSCGGCNTCSGGISDLKYGCCLECRDNPQIKLIDMIKNIY